jgi:hypothetical protein
MNIDRTIAPAYKAVTEIHFPRLKKILLTNGIPVYILNGGSQEVVKLDVMVGAGSLYTPKKLVAPLTGLMLN